MSEMRPLEALLLRNHSWETYHFSGYECSAFLTSENSYRLEMTTAMKRTLSTFCSDCAAPDLSLHGGYISRSLQDSAKVVKSRLLPRNSCNLAVIVSANFASQVVILRLMPLWGPRWVELGHSKVVVSWLLQFHVLFTGAPQKAQRSWELNLPQEKPRKKALRTQGKQLKRKQWGAQRKDFGGRYGFLVFLEFL